MRLIHLASALALCALLPLAPSPVLADHCGSSATMTPAVGPPGTIFVFQTNLGAPSDLDLYRNDLLVKSVPLTDSGPVRYPIRTGPGDSGAWRAHAAIRGRPDCVAEASFAVVGPPDTSTASDPLLPTPSSGALVWIMLVAAGLGAFVGLWRFAGRLPPA
jgi:hypothetical protein